jgi:hypothetical protein
MWPGPIAEADSGPGSDEFWDASFALAFTALAAVALGWILRRHKLLKVQFALAALLLLMVLFLATTVDPVYFTAGC